MLMLGFAGGNKEPMRVKSSEEDTPFVTLPRVLGALALVAFTLLIPTTSYAQATLAGIVRDTSGAVLPGLTVEAASPALIEKVRTAVTDGTGQYQLVDLRPGTYTVTFSLSGFRPARRENVAISGAGVITVNGEMSVGGVTETLVIQAETPVVETQTVRRQAVLESQTITELPAARAYGAILAAIPTLQDAGANASASVNPSFFGAHGGPGNEGRVMLDGLSVGAAFNGGGVSGNAYDTANAQEMQVSISGSLGEAEIGGRMVNRV